MNNVILWDRVMLWGLMVLVIFTPYSPAMVQGCLFLLMIAWVVKRSLMRAAAPGKSFISAYSFADIPLKWPLIAIGLLILLTFPFSHAPFLTLKKFFSRFLQQCFLMYVAAEIINSRKRLYLILTMLLWTLIVLNADVMVQYFRGESFIFSKEMIFQRVTGPMRHSNDLGSLLVAVIPVVLALTLTRRRWVGYVFPIKFHSFIYALTLGVLLFSIMSLGLTASRGAWVSFALVMLVFGFLLKNSRLMAGIIFSLISFFVVFGAYCINMRTDISPDHISQSPSSAAKVFLNVSRRDEYWSLAGEVIKSYPLFGCGYNAYIQTLKALNKKPEEYPHNSILQITAELGVLGLLAHLWFFVSLIMIGKKILQFVTKDKELYSLALGLCLGIMGWLIHSFMDTPWESLLLNLLWWLLIGILLSLVSISKQSIQK